MIQITQGGVQWDEKNTFFPNKTTHFPGILVAKQAKTSAHFFPTRLALFPKKKLSTTYASIFARNITCFSMVDRSRLSFMITLSRPSPHQSPLHRLQNHLPDRLKKTALRHLRLKKMDQSCLLMIK